jgi:hypothetical protein
MTDSDLYSIEEAQQRLGDTSRNTVHLWLRSGKPSNVVVGCRRFISAKAIADLIATVRQRFDAEANVPARTDSLGDPDRVKLLEA